MTHYIFNLLTASWGTSYLGLPLNVKHACMITKYYAYYVCAKKKPGYLYQNYIKLKAYKITNNLIGHL